MVTVHKKKGENNDAIFRRFGRLVIDEDLQNEFRERMFYMKPSQVRKEKEKNRGKNRRRRRTN
jgi:ribosomal protein S21